jgi:hypothetical protein
VKKSDDGSKLIKTICREDCKDSKSGYFVENNDFESKGYCRCSGGVNLTPSVLLAAAAVVVFFWN